MTGKRVERATAVDFFVGGPRRPRRAKRSCARCRATLREANYSVLCGVCERGWTASVDIGGKITVTPKKQGAGEGR